MTIHIAPRAKLRAEDYYNAIDEAGRGNRSTLIILLRSGIAPSRQALELLADFLERKRKHKSTGRRRGRPIKHSKDMFPVVNLRNDEMIAEYREASRAWGKTRDKERRQQAIATIAKSNGVEETYVRNLLKRGLNT